MELGLFDDAAENFSKAIERADENLRTWATYGRGVALLAMAQRDNKDGKCGSAYDLASKAIEGCESLKENKAGAIWKLLGDLYTFGASLPVDVFESDESIGRIALQEIQLAFVANGEDAYTRADQVIQDGPDSDDNIVLRASFVTDLGVNKLLQAQMLGAFESEGLAERSTRVNTMFEKAADEFRRALELCPVYAPAWCGLGCSVAAGDPLLAQHAFCRSIDLDHQFPDAYCNLSFLYTQRSSFSHSASVSDAVTQIADTPMMWINRALILEHESVTRKPEESADRLRQAADAYRAALQVEKDPSAMFGLALTCHFDKSLSADSAALESYGYTTEYLGGTNSADLAASVLNGIFSMRLGTTGPSQAERIAKGGEQVRDGLDRIRGISAPSEAATNFNVDLIESILRPASSEGPDDGDADTTAHPDWKNLSLCRKIIHEPQRGDLWLALAKELAMEKGSISEAKRAIHRALSILNHQREKFSRTQVQNSVDARDLSDAYAISYWLEQCQPSATEENESSSARQEEEEEGPTNVVSTLDLQRALLICPNNALARAALLKQTAA